MSTHYLVNVTIKQVTRTAPGNERVIDDVLNITIRDDDEHKAISRAIEHLESERDRIRD
jgi:uncharacterized ferredoxin-like protein